VSKYVYHTYLSGDAPYQKLVRSMGSSAQNEFLPLNREVIRQLMDESMEEVIDEFGEDAHPLEELGELIFDNFLCRLGNSGYKPTGGGWWHTQWDGEKLHITAPDGTYMGAIGPDSVSARPAHSKFTDTLQRKR